MTVGDHAAGDAGDEAKSDDAFVAERSGGGGEEMRVRDHATGDDEDEGKSEEAFGAERSVGGGENMSVGNETLEANKS
jgi:hypothetical protein